MHSDIRIYLNSYSTTQLAKGEKGGGATCFGDKDFQRTVNETEEDLYQEDVEEVLGLNPKSGVESKSKKGGGQRSLPWTSSGESVGAWLYYNGAQPGSHDRLDGTSSPNSNYPAFVCKLHDKVTENAFCHAHLPTSPAFILCSDKDGGGTSRRRSRA